MSTETKWDIEIESRTPWLKLNLEEVWRYRDLLFLFVRRDYKASFKQTILGPIWFFVQPVFTTLVYTFVFNRLAGVGTDGKPAMLFYLSGIILWNYFSTCLISTSNTFIANANIFGKVYFPRLILPFSIVISNLMKFGVQFLFFMGMYVYYLVTLPGVLEPSWTMILTPLFIVMMAVLGLSMGMFISSLTTKYRDLNYLVQFGVQLMMYATPIVYPASLATGKIKTVLMLNPMTGIVEGFRYSFLGSGSFDWAMLVYSGGISLVLLFIAVLLFNRVEKGFMDTV